MTQLMTFQVFTPLIYVHVAVYMATVKHDVRILKH